MLGESAEVLLALAQPACCHAVVSSLRGRWFRSLMQVLMPSRTSRPSWLLFVFGAGTRCLQPRAVWVCLATAVHRRL